MRLEQIESSDASNLDKLRYTFAHHAEIEDAPSKLDLFKALVTHHFGPNSPNHFIWNPWAERMAECLCQYERLGVIGCANSGKTDLGAIWALINWDADPINTLVMVTSTSLKDSKKRMWGRIERYYNAAPEMIARGHLVASIGMLRTRDPESPKGVLPDDRGIALIAGEKKKEKDMVGKIIGMKAPRVFLIADELPELSEALAGAFDYNLSMNPGAQMVGIGNFNSIHDPLGIFVRPIKGYSSITTEDTEWETEFGYCLRFDGLKSPNFFTDDDKDHWPFIYNRKNLRTHKKLGENTIQFWRMCRSFPCPLGVEDCIYSDADFLAGQAQQIVVITTKPIVVLSCDPSYTHGGDRCPALVGSFGDINGVPTLSLDEVIQLREDVTRKTEARNMQIAQQFKELGNRVKCEPRNAALDGSGAGMPFADIVHTLWSTEVMVVQFGGAASQRPVYAHDPRPAHELYGNRVSELWFVGVEFMKGGQLKGITDEIARQMKARKYTTQKAITLRTVVEPKPDLKERLGFSPDEADAYFVMLELCRQRFGFCATGSRVSFANVRRIFLDRARKANELYNDLYSESSIVNVE